jgi:ribonucleoside-diphosphate reductase beta chain|tara:strand:+ start:9466 stop:10437 length:972 start_codon:yes stop_codon:yes gene_type:complete
MSKLKLTDSRDYFKPFQHPEFYDIWLKHEQSHWLHTEVPMAEDIKDWKSKLSVEEKYFLTQIFRFFTQSDLDVAGGYVENYLPSFSQPEIRMMLCSFVAREALHVAAYSHLIETLGMPESTYNEFNEYEAMREKHEYFIKKIGNGVSLPIKIAAISAFTEGLALFSSFIMLLNFPRHGKMKGMGQIITWSIVDETMHTEAMIRIFRILVEENKSLWNDSTKKQIYDIAEKMVELEDKFIDLSFQMGTIKGLRGEEVKQYIRYIADRRLISMGMKGIFKVKRNPLPWVETLINAPIHTNFFENRATDYAKGALTGNWQEIWGNA